MGEIRLTSEITVEEIQAAGSDAAIVAAARTSTRGRDASAEGEQYGLLRYLLKHRHGSPLEHGLLTCRVHAPAFVWWEWVRHRFQAVDCPDLSYSLESGRYRELEPVFWVPRRDRPMVPDAGHKPARPKFRVATEQEYAVCVGGLEKAYRSAWEMYAWMRTDNGEGDGPVATEVARAGLGFGVYYAGWVSGNPRAILQFLSLRIHHDGCLFETHPQREIQEAAVQVERLFAGRWPLTFRAFVECGRVAP